MLCILKYETTLIYTLPPSHDYFKGFNLEILDTVLNVGLTCIQSTVKSTGENWRTLRKLT